MAREGLVIPPRPSNLPPDARYVASPTPHWRQGAEEPGSGQPVGVQTYWTPHGEPIRYERYDLRGRLLSRRSSHTPDPIVTWATRFREEPDRFDWYAYRDRYDDEADAALFAVARDGTAEHRLSYAQALVWLDQRRGRTRAITIPRHDRIRALFEVQPPASATALRDADTFGFTAFALDAMITLGDDAGLRTWGPPWLEIGAPPRPRDRFPDEIRPRVERALAGEPPSDPIARAQRQLGRFLWPVLGAPGTTPALLVDDRERAYWLDGDTIEAVSLEVDATGPSVVPSITAVGPLMSRSLVAAPGRGAWLQQRYRHGLYLFGLSRSKASLKVEPAVDLVVRCPDDAWTDRLIALFDRVRPFADEPTEHHRWDRIYNADRDHVHARGAPRLGVSAPVTAGTLAAFDAAEHDLLVRGCYLANLVPA